MLKTTSSTDSSASAAPIVVEFDGVDTGGGGGGKSVKKLSKSPKNLNGLKSRKGHRLGGMFFEAPILRQRTRTSNRTLIVFSGSFCWAQELSRYHFRSDYQQSKASEAVDTLLRFSPEEPGRSSNLSLAITNGPSALKFVCETHILPPLKFWRCAPEENVPAQDQGGEA